MSSPVRQSHAFAAAAKRSTGRRGLLATALAPALLWAAASSKSGRSYVVLGRDPDVIFGNGFAQ